MRQEHPMRIWQLHARSALAEVFLEHPRTLGESYWQHQRRARRFGLTLIGAGAACLVHGLVPALFQKTGSSTVQSLYEQLLASKRLKSTHLVAAVESREAACANEDYGDSVGAA